MEKLRQHNRWFAVALVALIAAGTLTLTWASSAQPSTSPSGADASSPVAVSATGFSLFGTYQSPDRCRECHPDEYEAWSGTTHAQASFDPIFQTYLQTVESPGECFACHTTGYDMTTGQFALAGVSCEACHGPYRPNHPQESMTVAESDRLCGHCHPSTLAEWQSSRHGQVGVRCVACHEVHSQKTRAGVVTNGLCAKCHAERTQDATHHQHIAAGLLCVDCHLSRTENVAGAISGHASTGHSFAVPANICVGCHPTGTPQTSS
jgi:hypothetical protein